MSFVDLCVYALGDSSTLGEAARRAKAKEAVDRLQKDTADLKTHLRGAVWRKHHASPARAEVSGARPGANRQSRRKSRRANLGASAAVARADRPRGAARPEEDGLAGRGLFLFGRISPAYRRVRRRLCAVSARCRVAAASGGVGILCGVAGRWRRPCAAWPTWRRRGAMPAKCSAGCCGPPGARTRPACCCCAGPRGPTVPSRAEPRRNWRPPACASPPASD